MKRSPHTRNLGPDLLYLPADDGGGYVDEAFTFKPMGVVALPDVINPRQAMRGLPRVLSPAANRPHRAVDLEEMLPLVCPGARERLILPAITRDW